jgi:CO/xanthine dehydrogenase FAD-binding subunit
VQPRSLEDALSARAGDPDALVVAGGTGVMVELNRPAASPPRAIIDLSRIAGRRDATTDERSATIRLAAGTTYTDVLERHAETLPGLAAAARTVASRQIRNRATLAGALVLADPSGDALAALGAAGATVELASAARGTRKVDVIAFVKAPGACDLERDELVVALHVPRTDGPTAYAKAGARNAMARAVCGVAVALHPDTRKASVCVVGCGPTAIRPEFAEALITADWSGLRSQTVPRRFGALVAAAVDPIPDARGSEEYRRHIAGVLAERALRRAAAGLAA